MNSKEADIDRDHEADVILKNNKIKDMDKLDNILVFDSIVVNAVTNDQWKVVDDELKIVNNPSFKMVYDSDTKQWNKVEIN